MHLTHSGTRESYPPGELRGEDAGESTCVLKWMIVESCSTLPLFPQARVGEVPEKRRIYVFYCIPTVFFIASEV